MYDHISIGRTFFDCAIAAWAEWARPALAKLTHQNRATCSLRIPVYLPRASCRRSFLLLWTTVYVHIHPLVLWFNPRLVVFGYERSTDGCVCARSIDWSTVEPTAVTSLPFVSCFCGVLFLLLFPGQTNFTASHTEETQNYWQSVDSQFLMIAMSDQIAA